MKHTLGVTALALCAACSGAAPSTVSEPTPATPDARLEDSALCATLTTEQRAELDAWNAAAEGDEDAAPIDEGRLPEALFDCVSAQDGVWGLVLTQPERHEADTSTEWTGEAKVVHLDRAGARVEWGERLSFESDCHDALLELTTERVADADRALLSFTSICSEGESHAEAHILVVDGPELRAATGAPEGGEQIVDHDEDGLHDLVIAGPFSTKLFLCEDIETFTPYTSLRLAHALPEGDFSVDDEAARAYVRGGCESSLRAKPRGAWDAAQALVCARYFGASVEDIEASLATLCEGYVEPDCIPEMDAGCEEPACVNELCHNAPALLELVTLQPPFTLD